MQQNYLSRFGKNTASLVDTSRRLYPGCGCKYGVWVCLLDIPDTQISKEACQSASLLKGYPFYISLLKSVCKFPLAEHQRMGPNLTA